MDRINGIALYTEPLRYLPLRDDTFQGANLVHLLLCELRTGRVFPLQDGPVLKSVQGVLCGGFPRQMFLGHAAEMPLAALVRCMMLWSWCGAVNVGANNSRDGLCATVQMYLAVALAACGERPKQALIPVIGENDIVEVIREVASVCATGERIAVSRPAGMVCSTITALVMRPSAAFDFTGR